MPDMTVNCLSGFGNFSKNFSRSSIEAMPSCWPRMIRVGTVIFSGFTTGSREHMST